MLESIRPPNIFSKSNSSPSCSVLTSSASFFNFFKSFAVCLSLISSFLISPSFILLNASCSCFEEFRLILIIVNVWKYFQIVFLVLSEIFFTHKFRKDISSRISSISKNFLSLSSINLEFSFTLVKKHCILGQLFNFKSSPTISCS